MSDEQGAVSWFRYVPHRRVRLYEVAGWVVVATAPSHHERFSTLMRYAEPCGDRPPEPARGARVRITARIPPPPQLRWRGTGRR